MEDADDETLTGLTGVLRGNQGNVKPMHLTRRKIELLAKSNPDFHHSPIFGSVTLYGDDLEAPASPTTESEKKPPYTTEPRSGDQSS